MNTIAFNYSVDDKVIDRTGRIGFITDVSKRKSGEQAFYIESKEGGRWESEKNINSPTRLCNEANKCVVEFKYDLGSSVETSQDIRGIIDQMSFDTYSKRYYIKSKSISSWVDEEDIVQVL